MADKRRLETADDSARKPHPVYGRHVANLGMVEGSNEEKGEIDFAHESIFAPLTSHPQKLLTHFLPRPNMLPFCMPAHLDALCQTQPNLVPSPDVSVFLHRPDPGAAPDVNFAWRELLDYVSS